MIIIISLKLFFIDIKTLNIIIIIIIIILFLVILTLNIIIILLLLISKLKCYYYSIFSDINTKYHCYSIKTIFRDINAKIPLLFY